VLLRFGRYHEMHLDAGYIELVYDD
jgi:hypothetical protein